MTCVYVAGHTQAGSFLHRLVVLYQGCISGLYWVGSCGTRFSRGFSQSFVRITSLCGVISANLVRGLGYRLGSSCSLLFEYQLCAMRG